MVKRAVSQSLSDLQRHAHICIHARDGCMHIMHIIEPNHILRLFLLYLLCLLDGLDFNNFLMLYGMSALVSSAARDRSLLSRRTAILVKRCTDGRPAGHALTPRVIRRSPHWFAQTRMAVLLYCGRWNWNPKSHTHMHGSMGSKLTPLFTWVYSELFFSYVIVFFSHNILA